MAVLVFTVPESPSWLVHRRLYTRADSALSWLGRDQEEFASEVEQEIQNRKLDSLLHRLHLNYHHSPTTMGPTGCPDKKGHVDLRIILVALNRIEKENIPP